MNQTFTWEKFFLWREPIWLTRMGMLILNVAISVGLRCCENSQSAVEASLLWCRMAIPMFWVAPGQGAQAWAHHRDPACVADHFLLADRLGGERISWNDRQGRQQGEQWRRNKLPVSTLCFSLEIQTCCVCFPRLPWLLGKRLQNK